VAVGESESLLEAWRWVWANPKAKTRQEGRRRLQRMFREDPAAFVLGLDRMEAREKSKANAAAKAKGKHGDRGGREAGEGEVLADEGTERALRVLEGTE
jgi:hypothetical protein